MSNLTLTEGLGSQMYHFAALYAISEKSKHKICFFHENMNIGKGLLLYKIFPNIPIEIRKISELSNLDKLYYKFPITREIVVDSRVFELDPNLNYDFSGLFNSYKIWYPELSKIKRIYEFNADTITSATNIILKSRRKSRPLVSVHVRRGDYLLPLNNFLIHLEIDYFINAMEKFDKTTHDFIFFSDDIEWCIENFGRRENILYSQNKIAEVDLAAMSMCDHNIISNSSFGLWAGVLNKNKNRKVICPSKYLKNDIAVPHFNHAWFPDDFTPS